MVDFSAKVENSENHHTVRLKTGNNEHSISVPPKAGGFGSTMNGGEALLLALATCYCNDIYREANLQGIHVSHVSVEAEATHDTERGHIMENLIYHVSVTADVPQADIENLIRDTDTVAEIQNTLREGVSVKLGNITAISKS